MDEIEKIKFTFGMIIIILLYFNIKVGMQVLYNVV